MDGCMKGIRLTRSIPGNGLWTAARGTMSGQRIPPGLQNKAGRSMRKCLLIICLCAGLGTAAQTCTGGLGDPIVDITFGQGAGWGPPLAAGITNLSFQAADCPEDGYYTIANR